MSTSLLYHGFGVRDYLYVRTQYTRGGVIFTIERKMETCRCTACGSQNIWRQGVVVRRFRTVPIGGRGVELEARIPRLACQDCGVVRQAAVGFAEPRRSYTKLFER
jgi:transposase